MSDHVSFSLIILRLSGLPERNSIMFLAEQASKIAPDIKRDFTVISNTSFVIVRLLLYEMITIASESKFRAMDDDKCYSNDFSVQ